MSAMRFRLRRAPDQRLDLSPLTQARLAGLDAAAIERIPLNTTRAPLCVGDIFRLRMGTPDDIVIEGGSERFDGVGEGMTDGSLLLDGDAGLRAGRAMAGGVLEVRGSVGPWAASGMRDGHVVIAGDAAECLGGPLPGESAGMRGGTVLVMGDAGPRAGDRLRRGVIVVEGDAGAHAGSRMIAGTLIVCGEAGELPGVLMRRGTLVLGGGAALPPGFVPAGDAGPVFLRLLAASVRPFSPRAARLLARPNRRFAGDMATLGKGEAIVGGA